MTAPTAGGSDAVTSEIGKAWGRKLDNDALNFINTATAAVVALALA